MPEDSSFVQCYNTGCGQKFDPSANDKDECRHHPGAPVFHDAYKGWSCCSKKCTDFTEFLNIRGCTLGKHSNEKPPEPEKPVKSEELNQDVIEVKAPARIVESTLVRPPFDTPLVSLQTTVAQSLKEQLHKVISKSSSDENQPIEIGTSCKNGGCSCSYEGPSSDTSECVYHPGVPIFHEGLKFWSCCQKRTTDFNTFLSQPGCEHGKHKWRKDPLPAGTVKCRVDWHQTHDFVVVSIFAKQYHPGKSYVKANPIRLHAKLVFPQEGDAVFEIDLELRGIIVIEQSSASMLGTKVEIKLRKAEPGTWPKLDFPREKKSVAQNEPKIELDDTEEDDAIDLSDIDTVRSMNQVNISGI